MAAHAIASATISFGLVSVPVDLYSASEAQGSISFHLINPATGARVKQKYVDANTGEDVARENLVSGYEVEKNRYVTFSKDEIRAMEQKKTDSIDIEEFVPGDAVDRMYFDKAYFLGPGKGGDRAYKLLAEAMKKTGLTAIGQYAARGKQYLVMLRPVDGGLVLETLHYADEVRSIKNVPLPDTTVKPTELTLAVQLIERARSDEFHPEQYHDTVRERMLEQIEKKRAGHKIVAEPGEKPAAKVVDLMDALKQSLARKGTKMAVTTHRAKAVTTHRAKAVTTHRAKAVTPHRAKAVTTHRAKAAMTRRTKG